MKVLVADDDADQLTLRCMLLERNGFRTVAARDARSALALAKYEKPDCAVLDLYFPNQESGFGLVRELKALDSGIHLVLLTGRAPRLDGRSEAGLIDEVVEKSLGSANLIRKLKAMRRDWAGASGTAQG